MSYIVETPDTIFYFKDAAHTILHRLDGPARVSVTMGDKEWWVDGVRHRVDDGPVVERTNGEQFWFINGKPHRVDGPARIYVDGRQEWWQNGALHRLDGPAVTSKTLGLEWYQYGLRHRVDGPAIERSGSKEWWQNGLKHRDDGPAVIRKNHTEWWKNGERHRLDGPAVEIVADSSNNSWIIFGDFSEQAEVENFYHACLEKLGQDPTIFPYEVLKEIYTSYKLRGEMHSS